tara:strand:- start:1462 stop:1965 length:504 start_codon:yes stop_codon:yes gene_type:complete
MATMLEIANGISQVLAGSYDGGSDTEGNPIAIGLKREEGHPINDARIMDGFYACIKGDSLRIKYHTEVKLREVHNSSFESEIELMIEKIKNFLVKEFKKVTGKALTLKDPSEVQVMVEYISKVRTSVRAHKDFKIGGVPATEEVLQGYNEGKGDPTSGRWKKLSGIK